MKSAMTGNEYHIMKKRYNICIRNVASFVYILYIGTHLKFFIAFLKKFLQTHIQIDSVPVFLFNTQITLCNAVRGMIVDIH